MVHATPYLTFIDKMTTTYLSSHRTPFATITPDSVMVEKGGLLIGASTSFGTLFTHPAIQRYHALHMALRTMCNPASRRQKMVSQVLGQDMEVQGTAAALMALNAELTLVRHLGERTLSLEDYFHHEEAKLSLGETVRSFFIPETAPESSGYQSVDYLRSGQAVCGVAVWAHCPYDTLEDVRIVLSGCTPHPIPLRRISAALLGKELFSERIEEATRKLGEERLMLHNPSLTLGSPLFNLSRTLIKRALLTL